MNRKGMGGRKLIVSIEKKQNLQKNKMVGSEELIVAIPGRDLVVVKNTEFTRHDES